MAKILVTGLMGLAALGVGFWKLSAAGSAPQQLAAAAPAGPFERAEFVRDQIPATPPLDGIFPPMSGQSSSRWDYIKTQYTSWYHRQSPAENNGVRGGGNGEAWRYDPMKTLVELCRRGEMLDDPIPGVCEDAKDTIAEFFAKQHWGKRGKYPDCSGGLTGITRGRKNVNPCDLKYGGHASALFYASKLYDQTPYSEKQKTHMADYCFRMGWGFGWITVDGLEDGFKERAAGISLQCLIDLHKSGWDVSRELAHAMGILHAMYTGDYSGEKIGAPMHSLNGHECSLHCPKLDRWMFSPWMGASFLIPALWEYWVFVEKDERVPEMIVLFGHAMLKHGIVDPAKWSPGRGPWRTKTNPTKWITLYFAQPYDKEMNIQAQDSEGWFSDLHNPEAIFALNAAYFFSCDKQFLERSEGMEPFFNQSAARTEPRGSNRRFLWQHRGSASTEWLLENAACDGA